MAERQISTQLSIDSGDGVGLELEVLKNVYMKEMELSRDHNGRVKLLFHVTPSTGEDLNRKYTYLDLHLVLPEQYPEEPVDITIPTSRGISDSHLKDILATLSAKAWSLSGSPMMYELVEYAKDSLTDNNLPCGDCVVCLLPFHDGEEVTRTDCYHYFHVSCLTRYLKFFERQQQELEDSATLAVALPTTDLSLQTKHLECPVCREPVASDAVCLEAMRQYSATGQHVQEGQMESVVISQEIRHWQERMAGLQQRQREKGGVIDVNAKDDVIDEAWVRPVTIPTSNSDAPPTHTGRRHKDRRQSRSPKDTSYGYGEKGRLIGGGKDGVTGYGEKGRLIGGGKDGVTGYGEKGRLIGGGKDGVTGYGEKGRLIGGGKDGVTGGVRGRGGGERRNRQKRTCSQTKPSSPNQS